ncbi:cytochrome P450 [Nonomuraea diastatica]|uniref:cytochrome P450 n=1 Tax=Nonomuraea diastatica TaxID=1848329 RepID=UPI001C70957D|nr:cytochrome P450 [Nonomuraea diastatica]
MIWLGVLGPLIHPDSRPTGTRRHPRTRPKLDIERGARHHLAFGFGPHQCLGQNLARMELQVVFDTLFRPIPTLRLATPIEDLPFKTDAVIYGAHELPITW